MRGVFAIFVLALVAIAAAKPSFFASKTSLDSTRRALSERINALKAAHFNRRTQGGLKRTNGEKNELAGLLKRILSAGKLQSWKRSDSEEDECSGVQNACAADFPFDDAYKRGYDDDFTPDYDPFLSCAEQQEAADVQFFVNLFREYTGENLLSSDQMAALQQAANHEHDIIGFFLTYFIHEEAGETWEASEIALSDEDEQALGARLCTFYENKELTFWALLDQL